MSAGTITIKNNTAAVVGDGTTFTTELAAGDFIVIKAGGVTYTLPVKSVESDTALTLSRPYAGPAASGSAWTAMPRDTLNSISAQIAADTSYAIRQRVLEIDNWYQLLEVNGEVTINMADGSSYTGPSWLRLIDLMNALDIDQITPLADQIRADAAQVAEDKPVIVQAKDDAEAAAAAAAASQKAAASSEEASASSETAAADSATAAAKSAQEAASHNPVEALVRSSNLSDLADRAAAWLNVRPVGSTPLSADPVSAYDATTKRWVENLVGAGTTGPTMNGVMNFGVGQSIAWDSRAYIPPYALPKDGQLVNRADWPELWAHAQQHGAIDDVDWVSTPSNRGNYSNGNGTTTFRLPDWNGVQKNGINGFTGPDSIPNLFFRGTNSSANDKRIYEAAAPNITGSVSAAGAAAWQGGTGSSLYATGTPIRVPIQMAGETYAPPLLKLDASESSKVFGRGGSTTIIPDTVNGVWIVRASGGFVAANTSWAVINADAIAPGANVTTTGGSVRSQYNIGASEKHSSEFFSVWNSSSTTAGALIRVNYGGLVKDFVFDSTGALTIDGQLGCNAVISKGIGYSGGLVRFAAYATADVNSVNQVYTVQNAGSATTCYQVTVPGISYQHVWRLDHDGQNKYFSIRSDNNMYTPIGAVAIQGCDVRIKYGFEPPKAGAWERIEAIGICEFKYNGSTTQQRGPLAQQMADIDPVYVFEGGTATDENGKDFEILNVNEKAVMADMITVIQELQARVKELEARLK